MVDITIHVVHEWRQGPADPSALILEGIQLMSEIAARLTASVDSLALALANQSTAIGEVASAIRNHPSSTTDNGSLSALADRLDGITASITQSAQDLHGLAGEEQAEDAGDGSDQPPVGDGSSAGASDQLGDSSGGDATGQPVGAGDGSEGNLDSSTGGASDGASGFGDSSATTSGDGTSPSDGSDGVTAGDGGTDSLAPADNGGGDVDQADTASGDGFRPAE